MADTRMGVTPGEGFRVEKEETFADRLRALREKAGLSAYRLAFYAGLTKQAVSRLERGQAQPSWATVQALAKALEVPTDAFVIEQPKKRK
jgi:transcriptional regulator with XRE-family HTH domain